MSDDSAMKFTGSTSMIVKAFAEKNASLNNDHDKVFDSLVVLEFSLKVPPPAVQWILEKIKLVKSKGGSELSVCPIVNENHEVYCYKFL